MKIILAYLVLISLLSCSAIFPIKVSEAEDITIDATPERLARGEYLVESVSGCTDCHAKRDWSLQFAPVIPGSEGAGGEVFNEDIGFPGSIHAPNITPAALGSWSDGEIVRAITAGVNKEGTALFPIMPYPNYSRMSQEDIYSIVAYLRTLPAVENQVPPRKLNFPLNLIVRTMPQDAEFGILPYRDDAVAYGKYMATAAGCADCHTPMKKGKPLEGMDYAGGYGMGMPSGDLVNSANLTPHETGLKLWSRQGFIDRFKVLNNKAAKQVPLKAGEKSTPMPWTYYARMDSADLGAIYDFLMSLPPVDNAVVKYPEM